MADETQTTIPSGLAALNASTAAALGEEPAAATHGVPASEQEGITATPEPTKRTPEEIEAIIREKYFTGPDGTVDEAEFQAYKEQVTTPALERLDAVYEGLGGWINRVRTSDEGLLEANSLGLKAEDTYAAISEIFGDTLQHVNSETGAYISAAQAKKLPEGQAYVTTTAENPEAAAVLAHIMGGTASNGLYAVSAIGSGLQTLREAVQFNWTLLKHDNLEVAWATAVGVKQARETHGDLNLTIGAWIAAFPELVNYVYQSILGTDESAQIAKAAWHQKKAESQLTNLGETQLSATDFASITSIFAATTAGLQHGSLSAAHEALVGRATENAHISGTRQEVRIAQGVMRNTFLRDFTAAATLYTAADGANQQVEPERTVVGPVDHSTSEIVNQKKEALAELAQATVDDPSVAVATTVIAADQVQKGIRARQNAAPSPLSIADNELLRAQAALGRAVEAQEAAQRTITNPDMSETNRTHARTQTSTIDTNVTAARAGVTTAQTQRDVALLRQTEITTNAARPQSYLESRARFVLGLSYGDPRVTTRINAAGEEVSRNIFNRTGSRFTSLGGSLIRGGAAGLATYALTEGLPLSEENKRAVTTAGTGAVTADVVTWSLGKAVAGARLGAVAGFKPSHPAVTGIATVGGAAIGFFFPNEIEAVTDRIYRNTAYHLSEEARDIRHNAAWKEHNGDALLANTILNIPLVSPEELRSTPFGENGHLYKGVMEAKYALNDMIVNAPEPLTSEHIEQVQAANAVLQEQARALVMEAIVAPSTSTDPVEEIDRKITKVGNNIIQTRASDEAGSMESRQATLRTQAQSIEESMISYSAAVETFRGSDAGKQWIAQLEAQNAARQAALKAEAGVAEFTALQTRAATLIEALPAQESPAFSAQRNALIRAHNDMIETKTAYDDANLDALLTGDNAHKTRRQEEMETAYGKASGAFFAMQDAALQDRTFVTEIVGQEDERLAALAAEEHLHASAKEAILSGQLPDTEQEYYSVDLNALIRAYTDKQEATELFAGIEQQYISSDAILQNLREAARQKMSAEETLDEMVTAALANPALQAEIVAAANGEITAPEPAQQEYVLTSDCALEACIPIQGRALRSEVAAVAGNVETEVLLGPRVELLAALEAQASATPPSGHDTERMAMVQ